MYITEVAYCVYSNLEMQLFGMMAIRNLIPRDHGLYKQWDVLLWIIVLGIFNSLVYLLPFISLYIPFASANVII